MIHSTGATVGNLDTSCIQVMSHMSNDYHRCQCCVPYAIIVLASVTEVISDRSRGLPFKCISTKHRHPHHAIMPHNKVPMEYHVAFSFPP